MAARCLQVAALLFASNLRVGALSVAPSAPAPTPVGFNPYSTVISTNAGEAGLDFADVAASRRYLIATFPNLKQVAYCHLPDNVWRPLVIGDVSAPGAVAVDAAHNLLFVADASDYKIYKYKLSVRENGLLTTDGTQGLAIDGYAASWMAVNGIGDLYFTGKATVTPPASAYDAVYRQDASKISFNNALTPRELFNRANSGSPAAKVWSPSGIAVDSFYVYWANQESGTTHGSLNKGSRQNVVSSHSAQLETMSFAQDEVRGAMVTGQAVFYLTPQGIYGLPKNVKDVTDENEGLIAGPPAADANGKPFDPRSIAFDGEATAYVTDSTSGLVYSVPATNLKQHNLTKFVDAPGVLGITVLNFDTQSGAHARGFAPVALFLALVVSAWSAAA